MVSKKTSFDDRRKAEEISFGAYDNTNGSRAGGGGGKENEAPPPPPPPPPQQPELDLFFTTSPATPFASRKNKHLFDESGSSGAAAVGETGGGDEDDDDEVNRIVTALLEIEEELKRLKKPAVATNTAASGGGGSGRAAHKRASSAGSGKLTAGSAGSGSGGASVGSGRSGNTDTTGDVWEGIIENGSRGSCSREGSRSCSKRVVQQEAELDLQSRINIVECHLRVQQKCDGGGQVEQQAEQQRVEQQHQQGSEQQQEEEEEADEETMKAWYLDHFNSRRRLPNPNPNNALTTPSASPLTARYQTTLTTNRPLNTLSLPELQLEKRSTKRRLQKFDGAYYKRHGRPPRKEDKEQIRDWYEVYNAIKVRIGELERGEATVVVVAVADAAGDDCCGYVKQDSLEVIDEHDLEESDDDDDDDGDGDGEADGDGDGDGEKMVDQDGNVVVRLTVDAMPRGVLDVIGENVGDDDDDGHEQQQQQREHQGSRGGETRAAERDGGVEECVPLPSPSPRGDEQGPQEEQGRQQDDAEHGTINDDDDVEPAQPVPHRQGRQDEGKEEDRSLEVSDDAIEEALEKAFRLHEEEEEGEGEETPDLESSSADHDDSEGAAAAAQDEAPSDPLDDDDVDLAGRKLDSASVDSIVAGQEVESLEVLAEGGVPKGLVAMAVSRLAGARPVSPQATPDSVVPRAIHRRSNHRHHRLSYRKSGAGPAQLQPALCLAERRREGEAFGPISVRGMDPQDEGDQECKDEEAKGKYDSSLQRDNAENDAGGDSETDDCASQTSTATDQDEQDQDSQERDDSAESECGDSSETDTDCGASQSSTATLEELDPCSSPQRLIRQSLGKTVSGPITKAIQTPNLLNLGSGGGVAVTTPPSSPDRSKSAPSAAGGCGSNVMSIPSNAAVVVPRITIRPAVPIAVLLMDVRRDKYEILRLDVKWEKYQVGEILEAVTAAIDAEEEERCNRGGGGGGPPTRTVCIGGGLDRPPATPTSPPHGVVAVAADEGPLSPLTCAASLCSSPQRQPPVTIDVEIKLPRSSLASSEVGAPTSTQHHPFEAKADGPGGIKAGSWQVHYDGVIQCREGDDDGSSTTGSARRMLLINCIGLSRYEVAPFEVFVAKPVGMSAKETSRHAARLMRLLVGEGMLQTKTEESTNGANETLTILSDEAKDRTVVFPGRKQPMKANFLVFSPVFGATAKTPPTAPAGIKEGKSGIFNQDDCVSAISSMSAGSSEEPFTPSFDGIGGMTMPAHPPGLFLAPADNEESEISDSMPPPPMLVDPILMKGSTRKNGKDFVPGSFDAAIGCPRSSERNSGESIYGDEQILLVEEDSRAAASYRKATAWRCSQEALKRQIKSLGSIAMASGVRSKKHIVDLGSGTTKSSLKVNALTKKPSHYSKFDEKIISDDGPAWDERTFTTFNDEAGDARSITGPSLAALSEDTEDSFAGAFFPVPEEASSP